MAIIIGVRFRHAGKIYYFDPDGNDIRRGSYVIVETARGIEIGRVVMDPREINDEEITQPLRKVIRIATEQDNARRLENDQQAKEAFSVCKKKIREHNLDMKLIDAEYTFDHKKLVFYFTADGRVDFRELIKDLASVFKTRIELRQIGVRDETKMLGGIGICGRPVCCSTYLSDFIPVSIKMAKEQNLSLNPTKISGACGRLMCCLKNEQETYEYLNRQLPNIGDIVENEEGLSGEVQTVNILKQTVRVLIETDDETTVEEMPADQITILERHKKGARRRKERDARAEQEQRQAAAREQAKERAAERKSRRTKAIEQARAAKNEDTPEDRHANPHTDSTAGVERSTRNDRHERPQKHGQHGQSSSAGNGSAAEKTTAGNAAASGRSGEESRNAAPEKQEKRRRRRHRRKSSGEKSAQQPQQEPQQHA
ncbi:MAG: hypothetical protein IJI10_05280 [Eubacterium sp.]|nr:hypothetical protein [Eubacterium sp.]